MEFTKTELNRIIRSLKQDNIRMEFDLAYEDMNPLKRQMVVGSIKLNDDLIAKIQKDM